MFLWYNCFGDFMTILHIDVNSAFLSWTAVNLLENNYTTDIRNIPSVIAGDPNKRKGIILAKSISAKKYNIHTGETIFSAMKKCPNLKIFPPDFTLYKQNHDKFISLLREYFDNIEVASIDECYIDYTNFSNLYGDVITFAYNLKKIIKQRLKFTVNIGIGDNKVLAKMASDFEKPDKVHTLFKNQIEDKLWPLDISKLFLLGKKSEEKLKNVGFKTIGDIANSNKEYMYKLLKKQGLTLFEYARGIDNSKICSSHILKSISSSETLLFDISDKSEAYKQLLNLSEIVAKRLRENNFFTSVISIEIKNSNFEKYSHQQKIEIPTNNSIKIYEIAKVLFDKMWKNDSIRNIGLCASSLSTSENLQMNFFSDLENIVYNQKLKNLDVAMDNIKNKYNKEDVIKRGSLL